MLRVVEYHACLKGHWLPLVHHPCWKYRHGVGGLLIDLLKAWKSITLDSVPFFGLKSNMIRFWISSV